MPPYRKEDSFQPDQEIMLGNIADMYFNGFDDANEDDGDVVEEENINNIENDIENDISEEEEEEEEEDEHINNIGESGSGEELKLSRKQKLMNGYIRMIIDVLIPIRTWNTEGFSRLMELISGSNINLDSVKDEIKENYTNMQETLKPMLKSLSQQKQQPYSLGVEIYSSQVRYRLNLDVYVHYVNKESPYEMHSVLYENSQIWLGDMCKMKDWETKFVGFDLSNCSAIILSGNLKHALKGFTAFFSQYKIPIIPCMDHVINCCLKSIFKLRVIKKAVRRLHSHIDKDRRFDPHADMDCYTNSAWSQLNYFQLYFESYDEHLLSSNCEIAPESERQFLQEFKAFIDYVYPLKIVLESAVEEPLPLFCSVMRPMLKKVFDLLESKKSELATNKYVIAAYNKIKKKLPLPIMTDNFVMEATFFDRRFDFDMENEQHIKKNIQTNFKEFIADHAQINATSNADGNNNDGNSDNMEEASTSSTTENKGFQKFFDRINRISNDKSNSNDMTKSDFEMEFNYYINEAKLDLDQCPVTWWYMNKNQYKILSKIASYYLTVPCCVNRLFKYEPNNRVHIQNKRGMLGGKDPTYYDPVPEPPHEVDFYLWYIRYNQKFLKRILKLTK